MVFYFKKIGVLHLLYDNSNFLNFPEPWYDLL